jgi:hypothetical protein
MRRAILFLCFAIGAAISARGQLVVDVAVDQEEYLTGESVILSVRIFNQSGQTVHFGEADNWLSLFVEGDKGAIVERLGEVPKTTEFDLESSKVKVKRVDVTPCFDIKAPGRYKVAVTVRVKGWTKDFASKPVSFDVQRGLRLWEQAIGVPGPSGHEPEMRKYTLQQARYSKDINLYVRVTDLPEATVYRVLRLGQIVSFGDPEVQVDKLSNLHVLFQTGQQAFLYCVINPTGKLVIRQTHNYSADSRPRLAVNEKSEIAVKGGIRLTMPSDLPIQIPGESTNEVSK